MTNRKKKLRIIQLILLALGSLIIFFTYYGEKRIIAENSTPRNSRQNQKTIK